MHAFEGRLGAAKAARAEAAGQQAASLTFGARLI